MEARSDCLNYIIQSLALKLLSKLVVSQMFIHCFRARWGESAQLTIKGTTSSKLKMADKKKPKQFNRLSKCKWNASLEVQNCTELQLLVHLRTYQLRYKQILLENESSLSSAEETCPYLSKLQNSDYFPQK